MTGQRASIVHRVNAESPDPEIIREAAACLLRGGLVAFPTETVYGLGANAFDEEAVRGIFRAKQRPAADPLIVHLASAGDLALVAAEVPAAAAKLAAAFWPGPLTLLLPKTAALPAEVTAGLETVAVRVPAHPVALALLRAAGIPVAAPSANRFAHTSPTLARHVEDDLGGRVDLILDAGPTPLGVESTVLDVLRQPPVILRPGGISRAELEAVVGAVRPALPDERLSSSPGRQPRHYAPYARLILCNGGNPDEIARSAGARASALLDKGSRVGLLAASEVCARMEPQLQPLAVRDLGSLDDLRTVARRLFAGLRELEAQNLDVILTHRMPSEGLGEALNDRLSRAAHAFHTEE
jgi:L-threonylcarbamoyladenylate synthase